MTPRALLLVPFVSAIVACGPPLKLVEPTKAKTVEPTAHADEEEPEKPEAKKKPKKAKGPYHWKDYAGPKVKTTITTKMVWAVVPVGLQGDFGTAKIALLEYVKPEGDEHLVKVFGDETIYVPQAMVQPAVPAKGVVKGTGLFVNVAAASGFGRATDVTADRVKVKYEWAGQLSDADLPLDEVIVLEDKVAFGNPVSYPVGAEREVGTVAFTDATSTWIVTGTGKVVSAPTKDVKPMKVQKPLKKGYNAFAPAPVALKPGKVTDVLDGFVRCKFKPDAGGDELTLSFHLVTIP